MKPGITTLTPPAIAGYPATVHVGAVQILLSNQSNPAVIIVRAEPGDERVRINTRGASDMHNQIDFHVEDEH